MEEIGITQESQHLILAQLSYKDKSLKRFLKWNVFSCWKLST